MKTEFNPFEPDETPLEQSRRIGRMIREGYDMRAHIVTSAIQTDPKDGTFFRGGKI